jgi:hypothetical protein
MGDQNATMIFTKDELEQMRRLRDVFGSACDFVPRLKIAIKFLLIKSSIQANKDKREGLKYFLQALETLDEGWLETLFLEFNDEDETSSYVIEIVKNWEAASKIDPWQWNGYGH